ncbi:phage baseplate assembly protein V [Azonexus sp.]|uniref:phage baseplate assembly protein V n=1 Tax=Azonexus sp. TaxID=1872668 RepID=UPI0035AE21FA
MLSRLLAPLARRLRLMVGRALITAISDAGKIQSAQVKLLDGEVRDGVEILHQYGFSSRPHGQPEGLYFAVGADRDHGVMICVADRQYRLRDLAPGEAALYDDLGQVVHLTRDGIVIKGAGQPVTITETPLVRIESSLDVTGEVRDRCDSSGKTMSAMRTAHNTHVHPENDSGGPTGTPTKAM